MLKCIKLNRNKARLAFICFTLLIDLSCGKRKPPLPPIERVIQRVIVGGVQQGSKITLTWTMPSRNASPGSVLNIRRADIYRLTERLTEPTVLSEEEFASNSTQIGSVPISENDFAKKNLNFVDTLEFTDQAVRLRYAVRFVNESGQKASFSNYLLIEPTSRVADIPTNLSARVTEEAVVLRWTKPLANVDNTRPANVLGYNVYREGASSDFSLLNPISINDPEFSDKSFEFNTNYRYFVRTVSLGRNTEPVESSDSKIIEIVPKDIFPPTPPTAVTIAAAPNNLSIFFAVNPERDIAGYNIYRSTNPNLPKSEWLLLTSKLISTNIFQDQKVEPGKTYFYFLTAVDNAGNVSAPSEIFSETSP